MIRTRLLVPVLLSVGPALAQPVPEAQGDGADASAEASVAASNEAPAEGDEAAPGSDGVPVDVHEEASPPAVEPAPPPPASSTVTPAEPRAPEPTTTRIALPPDRRTGHLSLSLTGAMAGMGGQLSRDADTTSLRGLDFGPGVQLAIGVGPAVMLGVYGNLGFSGGVDACPNCSSLSYGGGLLARYHLVQGLRFDPYIAYGIGVRGLNVEGPPDLSFIGLEWFRAEVGGDYYILPQFGVGPYVDLGLTSFLKAPRGDTPEGLAFRVSVGLRATFDLPGH